MAWQVPRHTELQPKPESRNAIEFRVGDNLTREEAGRLFRTAFPEANRDRLDQARGERDRSQSPRDMPPC